MLIKKPLLALLFIQFVSAPIFTQIPVTQIEGRLEVSHSDDSTSIYVGKMAGLNSAPGHGRSNTFFGFKSGLSNTNSTGNAFFGAGSGLSNTVGLNNSLFGFDSGRDNLDGSANAFYGSASGIDNSSGTANTFVGWSAGNDNIDGNFNSALGYQTKLNNDPLEYATVIGANTEVSTNNTLVFGRPVDAAVIPGRLIVGQPEPTIPDGIGTAVHINAGEDGDAELIIESDTNNGGSEGDNPTISLRQDGNTVNAFIAMEGNGGATSLGTTANSFLVGSERNNVPLHFITNDISRMTIQTNGRVVLNQLGAAGSTQLCRNGLLELATCSSSIRYKKEIQNYNFGLELINQLRPVSYKWKENNIADLGFIAEEIALIDERLITRNDKGEVDGVKYDRLTVLLVNAIKEQQHIIEGLQEQEEIVGRLMHQLEQQKALIERLAQVQHQQVLSESN